MQRCNSDLIGAGLLVAAGGVWVPFLGALIASIVLLVQRRIAFWVPIVGLLLSGGFTVAGAMMASAGAGS
ncbi:MULTISPECIES: hypothetical protein [unclassified Rathayibacter]|uniref:hypothetical protein n=1 Tax=unclassified Rathayibacter TaxID=2609250 RepID=UPI00188AE774|nr:MULTISPECIES: hypothetical protein [unclassified Rathayibacter]MBF4463119.1 hypothetical protein [Rathayibacter sp. VKM Ac-2879]MBF4504644.1 hypothetical protein [Rathayibacter sp. VKM Ac-2878]